jgi:hypothetical protein
MRIQNIIHRIRHKQEVSKVGEPPRMFSSDEGCELLNHSAEVSHALREIK